jgi:hypothetical protein
MRKIFAIILTMMLIASMTVSAYAVTPKFDINLPEIPNISGSVKVEVPDNFWDNWFREYTFQIDFTNIKLWGRN